MKKFNAWFLHLATPNKFNLCFTFLGITHLSHATETPWYFLGSVYFTGEGFTLLLHAA